MSKLVFYDTETNGFPVWGEPSGWKCQPHIVQLAAIVVDAEDGNVTDMLDVIVRPDGWDIPTKASDVHGITNERAADLGIDEREALDMFLEIRADHLRVAHNRNFDQRIIRIAMTRYRNKEERDRWALKDDHECTMLMCKKHGSKEKNLSGAYEHFMGEPLVDAHNALVDARACMDIYFKMRELRESGEVSC